MDNKIRSFALSALLTLAISACSLTGNDPNNPAIVDPPLLPAVELTVQADTAAPINAVGQNVAYTYTIRNTGTVSLPGVVSIEGATANCPPVNTIGNLDDFLDVGEALTCVSTYTTTQADLDNGAITTVTTANVNGTLSSPITTTVNTVPNRILTLTKTANPVIYEQVGQTITYNYVVTNSGTLDIGPTQFVITDTGASAPLNCGNADTTLAPNATATCTLSYTITQADMNADSIATQATVSGGGVGPSQPASATVTKSGLVQNPANLPVGSTIQHKVVTGEWLWQIARCYGADPAKTVQANSQLPDPAQISPDMTVTVPNIGTSGNIYGPPCVGTHVVQSGETWNSIALKYNADPLVLQKVNLTMPVGATIKVPLNSAGGTVTTSGLLTLTTAANPSSYQQLGEIITFTYVIKNDGTTTLGPSQFTVSDNLVSSTPVNCGGPDTTLVPTATVTCTAIYAITEADMTGNSVTSNATASGGGAVPSQTSSITVNKNVVATLTLVTSANPLTFNQAGEVITYTYVVKNNGTATIGPAQFTISDSLISATPFNCGAADTTLAPEELLTCTTTYTITEADLTSIFVTNNATASGGGAGPSASSSITINKE